MSQGVLPLGYVSSHHLGDFIVGPCNQLAFDLVHHAISQTTKDTFFCIHGDKSAGKTHLLKGMAQAFNLRYRTANQALTSAPWEWVHSEERCILLDDAQSIDDDLWWFHTYNMVREAGKTLVISCHKSPSLWNIQLPDWRSRLSTFISAELKHPDDDTLKRVMEKVWRDKGIVVDEKVIDYLTKRIDRNFATAHNWVNTLDTLSAQTKKTITIPMLKKLLG